LNYVAFLLVVVRVGRFYIDWKFGQGHRSNQPSAHHVDSKKKGHRVGVVHIHLVRQAVSVAYKPAVAVLL
jgi:hypothetical protein